MIIDLDCLAINIDGKDAPCQDAISSLKKIKSSRGVAAEAEKIERYLEIMKRRAKENETFSTFELMDNMTPILARIYGGIVIATQSWLKERLVK